MTFNFDLIADSMPLGHGTQHATLGTGGVLIEQTDWWPIQPSEHPGTVIQPWFDPQASTTAPGHVTDSGTTGTGTTGTGTTGTGTTGTETTGTGTTETTETTETTTTGGTTVTEETGSTTGTPVVDSTGETSWTPAESS